MQRARHSRTSRVWLSIDCESSARKFDEEVMRKEEGEEARGKEGEAAREDLR